MAALKQLEVVMGNNENICISVIDDICVKNKSSNREKILEYEEFAKKQPQIDIPVNHHIHGGMYGREITIPKGSIITGQIYKFDHFDIMVSGDITVSTDGEGVKRLKGFNVFKGMSGKKRAGYAHEDTRWITLHPFDGVNGDDIQSFITADNFAELEDFYININKNDYLNFVDGIGMTQEEIDHQVNSTDDLVEMPLGFEHLFVLDSKLNGRGFFSNLEIKSGEIICPARINGKRTDAGRYTNHAVNANAIISVNDRGDADLISLRDIVENEEITVNYRQVLQDRYHSGDLLCQE